jgi:hypothetical protein
MNEYRTTDIVLAAVIRLDGYQLVDIETQGNKGTLVNAPLNLLRSTG